MPIDFAAVADRYREPFRRETATIDLLFLRIGQRLVLAARRAAAVATTTTHLPDLDFVDGALVVRAMVPPTPGRPVGPDRIVDDLRRGVGQAVAGMEGAITGPANDMAFLDLLGGLARPLRAAAERPDTLVQLLGAATAAFARLSPPDTATSPAGPLADRIVEAAAKVTEAVGTLPALPGAFDAAVAAARATGDSAILGGAQRMEAELLGLRSDARWWILVAVDTAGVATLELLTLQHLVESGLATLATIPGALSTFTEALVPVLTSVREWANWISAVLVVYADAIRAVADLRIVLPGLVTPTLGELFEMGVDGTAKIMRQSLHAGLGVATPALSMAPTQVRGLHDLIDAVLMNPGPVPGGVVTAPMTVGFPDLSTARTGSERTRLLDAVDRAGLGIELGIRRSVDAAAAGIRDIGSRATLPMAQLPPHGATQPIDLGRLGEVTHLAGRPASPLADAWERNLVDQGFAATAVAMPFLLARMRELWRARRPPEAHPMSPHSLVRRARLHGMHVPELVVAVDGTALTDATAARVAHAVAAGIGDAATAALHRAELGGGR